MIDGPTGGAFRAIDVQGNLVLVGGDNGVTFLSTDTGNTWTRPARIFGPANGDIMSVAITPPNILHAVNEHHYFRSTNLGASWVMTDPYEAPPTRKLLHRPGMDFLGAGFSVLYRSTDGGLSWFGLVDVQSVLYDADRSPTGEMYAGADNNLYRSSDSGATWEWVWVWGPEAKDVEFGPDGRVFIANWTGVFHSSDHGVSWLWDSLSPGKVRSFYNPGNGDFYGCSQSGLYYSADSGKNWSKTDLEYDIHILRILPNGTFLAGGEHALFRKRPGDSVWSVVPVTSVITGGLCRDSAGAVYASTLNGVRFSTDRGYTWTMLDSTLGHQCTRIVADKANHVLFASLGVGVLNLPVTRTTPLVYRFLATRPMDFAVAPDNAIYAAMFQGSVSGLLRSRSGGYSWSSIGFEGENLHAVLAYDSTLVVSGGSGTYFRFGPNAEWERRNDGFVTNGVNTLVRDAGGRIYAGTYEGIYITDDEGGFWRRDTNALFGRTIGQLIINGPGEVLAATTSGVYLSRDRGLTWTYSGLGGRQTYAIIDLGPDTVLATSFDRAMYRGVIRRDPVAVEDGEGSAPAGFRLHQNYPNPFNSSTKISFELPSDQHVRVQVFTIQGSLMATLVDRELRAGLQHVTLDAVGWPTGIYLCKVSTRTVTAIRKMVLVR